MHWIALAWPPREDGAGSGDGAVGAGAGAADDAGAVAAAGVRAGGTADGGAGVARAAATGSSGAAADAAATAANAGSDSTDQPSPQALGWWALQFTPRVAWHGDACLLLEVSSCDRLWGGVAGLLAAISERNPALTPVQHAQGATALIAHAHLQLALQRRAPTPRPLDLPIDTLGAAAQVHATTLARLGCRTWGDLAALPRAGLGRRFGADLLDTLDAALGRRPWRCTWLELPAVFDRKVELHALVQDASALLWVVQRLLGDLQLWLQARQLGVLALQLEWTLDLRRIDGVDLPPHESLTVRTAEPTQNIAHLRRLLGERLDRTRMAAPASWLRLATLETVPWAGRSESFLPEDNRKGMPLHELLERLSARLGDEQVVVPVPQADHRPEHMQRWVPARQRPTPQTAAARHPAAANPLYPTWLLASPLRLALRDNRPWYEGSLRTLAGPQRLEAGWWGGTAAGDTEAGVPTVRDYYIAESPRAGLLWIFRQRPLGATAATDPHWYLHGRYA